MLEKIKSWLIGSGFITETLSVYHIKDMAKDRFVVAPNDQFPVNFVRTLTDMRSCEIRILLHGFLSHQA